jgi:hypothetical protein
VIISEREPAGITGVPAVEGLLAGFAKRFALAAVALITAQWLIVPGFLALDVPNHSDLWRYFAIGHDLSLRQAAMNPRPLMVTALRLFSPIHDPHLAFCLLHLPSLMFVAMLSMATDRLTGWRTPALAAFILYLLLFGTGTFYELDPLDYGGLLSGFFLSLNVIWQSRVRDCERKGAVTPLPLVVAVSSMLTYASFETKPTFAAVLPLVPLLLLGEWPLRRVLVVCGASVSVIALAVAKDIMLKSPFIQVGGAHGAYSVSADPAGILHALGFYVLHTVPPMCIPIALLGLWTTWLTDRRLLMSAIALPVLAVLPMCAIPSRLLSMYSWYGTALLGALLTAVIMSSARRAVVRASMGLAVLYLVAATAGMVRKDPAIRWAIDNQAQNRELFRGLEALQNRLMPGERILIAGPFRPFSPFQNDRFVALTTAVPFTWSVAYPRAEAPLVSMFNNSTRHVPIDEVDFKQFDRVAEFSPAGRLVSLENASEYITRASWDVVARVYCRNEMGLLDRDTRAIHVMECLSNNGEYAAAEAFGSELGGQSRNQWVWYQRGLASEALGHRAAAHEAYEAALLLEDASVFRDAANRTAGAQSQ